MSAFLIIISVFLYLFVGAIIGTVVPIAVKKLMLGSEPKEYYYQGEQLPKSIWLWIFFPLTAWNDGRILISNDEPYEMMSLTNTNGYVPLMMFIWPLKLLWMPIILLLVLIIESNRRAARACINFLFSIIAHFAKKKQKTLEAKKQTLRLRIEAQLKKPSNYRVADYDESVLDDPERLANLEVNKVLLDKYRKICNQLSRA